MAARKTAYFHPRTSLFPAPGRSCLPTKKSFTRTISWITTRSRIIAAIARAARTPTKTTIRFAATWSTSTCGSATAARVREVYFDGDGCCISQAAASMLVEHFDGSTVEDIKKFTANDMLELFGVRLTPNRQKCCLLPWRVLQSAIYSPVDPSGWPASSERQGRSAAHEHAPANRAVRSR